MKKEKNSIEEMAGRRKEAAIQEICVAGSVHKQRDENKQTNKQRNNKQTNIQTNQRSLPGAPVSFCHLACSQRETEPGHSG